jgi:opacity protein-like surface antigen
MKKISPVFLAVLMIFGLSGVAFGDQNNYFNFFVGFSSPSDSEVSDPALSSDIDLSYDAGYLFGAAVGHDFGRFRFDAEMSYQKNDIDEDLEGDITLFNLLANFYWDIISSGAFTPYLTTGLGLTSAEVKLSGANEHDAVTSMHFGTGVLYAFSDKASLDVRYRYQITSDFEISTSTIDFGSHSLTAGINWKF